MGNSSPPDDNDDWDDEVARALLNSIVLVGVSYVDPEDSVTDQEQFWGKVISVEQGSAIRLELLGTRVGEKFSLPPSTGGFDRAEPGHYELRRTGEIVVNPDFVSQWRVRKPVS